MLRWQILDPKKTGANGPSITTSVVKRDALQTVLPKSLRRITPDQRRTQLQARGAGYDRRFAPR